jgi:hypothetical protein
MSNAKLNTTLSWCGLFASVLFIVLLPYMHNAPNIGRFSLETLRYTPDTSSLGSTYCLATRRVIFKNSLRRRLSWRDSISLALNRRPSALEIGDIQASSSLLYSKTDRRIFIADTPSPQDRALLEAFSRDHLTNPKASAQFINKASRLPFACQDSQGDTNITDGYWATKGTGIIHHWVHLYESSFSDGKNVRHQYGTLIPRVARAFMLALPNGGPTSFAQIAWVLFAAAAVLYTLLVFRIFAATPITAALLILTKSAVFTSIAPFILLLAPGFHWYRELTIVIMAYASLLTRDYRGKASPGENACNAGILLGAAVICYALDPSFATIAISAYFLALIPAQVIGSDRLRISPFVRSIAIGTGLALLSATTISNFQLLKYIFTTATTLDYGLYHFDSSQLLSVSCIIILSTTFALRSFFKPQPFLLTYFSIATAGAELYYFVTPDNFHFTKSIEYAIPFFFLLASSIRFRSLASILALIILFSINIKHLDAQPTQWELRIKTVKGVSVFSSAHTVTIHQRTMIAEIDPSLHQHLNAYPNQWRYDYLVSPVDKYITFLYDKHNGFEDPDFVSWLDSDIRFNAISAILLHGGHHARVLLDDTSLDPAPDAAISSQHTVLGSNYLASQLNLKSRMRLYDLYRTIRAECASISTQADWRLVECG